LEELCANYEEKLNADAMASLGYKSYVTDKEFIDCAKALLINSLKAPSTASFSEGKVEVKDSYGRAIVSITSESENSFGVPIRSNNLLAISAVCSNGEFYYGHYYFAPYSNDTEKEYNIGLLKTANDFDKPRHDSVPVTSNNFTFYQESDDFKVYNYNDFALSYFDNAGNLCAIVTIRPIDNLKSDESVRKDISFWLAAAMGSTAQISSDNMDKCFDFTIYQPSQRFYEDGILSESFVSDGYAYFGAIAVSPSKYGAGMNSFESIMAAQTSKTDSENISTEPVPSSDSVSERQLDPPATGEEVAVLHTSMGDIKFRLFPQYAPKAVENFRGLISSGYYNNLTFHRVSNNFVIQGGDPNGDGTGGQSIWGTPFGIEVSDKLFHIRGALSMANVGPNTNGSQFFIVQSPTAQDIPADIPDWASTAYKDLGGYPYLDGQYSVFGQVYEGMDIVDKIAAVPVDSKDKPITPVIITSAELVILK
jgi:peptidyl-prolyl cis-trans isomerase B (cyclophilin B)